MLSGWSPPGRWKAGYSRSNAFHVSGSGHRPAAGASGPPTLLLKSSAPVPVLVLRNLLVMGLLVVAARLAWLVTAPPVDPPADGEAARQDLRRSSPSVG